MATEGTYRGGDSHGKSTYQRGGGRILDLSYFAVHTATLSMSMDCHTYLEVMAPTLPMPPLPPPPPCREESYTGECKLIIPVTWLYNIGKGEQKMAINFYLNSLFPSLTFKSPDLKIFFLQNSISTP